ncbi:hypothetical protein VTK73DRAFT_1848 [Phialemonium thermophilum]|uniref:Uncharacterized protein n=1 Tax=Phialemonium thermophilum TaxID=223376 RepID=A0ABR3VSW0_9PEZI
MMKSNRRLSASHPSLEIVAMLLVDFFEKSPHPPHPPSGFSFTQIAAIRGHLPDVGRWIVHPAPDMNEVRIIVPRRRPPYGLVGSWKRSKTAAGPAADRPGSTLVGASCCSKTQAQWHHGTFGHVHLSRRERRRRSRWPLHRYFPAIQYICCFGLQPLPLDAVLVGSYTVRAGKLETKSRRRMHLCGQELGAVLARADAGMFWSALALVCACRSALGRGEHVRTPDCQDRPTARLLSGGGLAK